MAYRPDPDLEFLGKLSSNELNDLVYLLTHDKDGSSRWTEFLTSNETYKRYYPDHQMYWQLIAEEIQLFGGNSLTNYLIRFGDGVYYKEILCDVCSKMKLKVDKSLPTKVIEQLLVLKVFEEATKKMSPEELKLLQQELNIKGSTFTPQMAYAGMASVIKLGGFKGMVFVRQVANTVARQLTGKGLAPVANAAIGRYMSIFAGPLGWAISGLWTAYDIAGTAYRVTVPAVFQIIYLRSLYESHQEKEEKIETSFLNKLKFWK